MQTLVKLSRELANGAVTSRALIEQCLARINDADGEGARVFLTLYQERALAEADFVDRARQQGWGLPRFSGIPISVKDLFDIEGEKTRAGSRVLDEQPAATSDAVVIGHLRRAGFIIVGKTNMTEFAYSGLGINAHFDTPRNPYERAVGRIPGGSSSGGAVSVADAMSMATIGTDTGGSCRIPAAFCSIVGFKPTSRRVSTAGAVPLSTTMDSIGPLANSVSCCAILDAVLAGDQPRDETSFAMPGVRLGVLEGYVTNDLEGHVANTFQAALARLSHGGVNLKSVTIPELAELPSLNSRGGIVGAEAYAWHRDFIESRSEFYDPWILSRFAGGKLQSAADYIELLAHRKRIRAAACELCEPFDALVLPTVAIVPPTLAAMQDLDRSNSANLLSLRNTAVGNFLDRPSISVPCHAPGQAPVGFMLMGRSGDDRRLLALARGLEQAIRG